MPFDGVESGAEVQEEDPGKVPEESRSWRTRCSRQGTASSVLLFFPVSVLEGGQLRFYKQEDSQQSYQVYNQ